MDLIMLELMTLLQGNGMCRKYKKLLCKSLLFLLIAIGLNVESEPGWLIKGSVAKMKLNFQVRFTVQSYPAC